jgi:uncharacterized membrane protein
VNYLAFKFAHILIAIVALGSGAALVLLLGSAARDPAHRAFALRVARRLLYVVVAPGYVLMLATGMWMGHLEALLDARWTEAAMNLWGVGALCAGVMLAGIRRQLRLLDEQGDTADESRAVELRRAAAWTRTAAAGWALVVVVILYLMVFKPG